ncbi:MAG: outer membrane beta-barrel protein [Desulfobacteraceae bacterium]|jgi:opacity protein-like surface antigen
MTPKIRAVLVLTMTLVLLLPISSTGQERRDYIIAKGGVYSPTGGLDDLNFGEGFNGEVAWGHYFSPNLALEVGAGYFETDDIRVVPFLATGKGIYPTGNWEFFAEVGVGAYFAKFDGNLNDPAVGSINFNDDDAVFGLSLGFGANYNITEEFFLGIGGKYLLTSDAEFGNAPTSVPATLETDLDGYIVTGVFGFRF